MEKAVFRHGRLLVGSISDRSSQRDRDLKTRPDQLLHRVLAFWQPVAAPPKCR